MNKKTFSLFVRRRSVRAIVLLAIAATATLASCSNDEMTDNQAEALPEGIYPLTFTAAVDGLAQTRAAGSTTADGEWTGAERIAVKAGDEVRIYTPSAGGSSVSLTSSAPFYWQASDETKTVSAWYCGDGSTAAGGSNAGAVPASWAVQSDQSTTNPDGYQCSDFLYAAEKNISFSNTDRSLPFAHQTARVVINIVKAEAATDAGTITNVIIGYGNNLALSGTYTAPAPGSATTGTWNTTDGSPGTITPKETATPSGSSDILKTYAALVIPQDMSGRKFIAVTLADGNTYYYTPQGTDAGLKSGNQYTYDITVKHGYLEVVTAETDGAWGDGGATDPVNSKIPVEHFTANDLKIYDYYYSDGKTSDGGYRKYADNSTAMLNIMPVLTDPSTEAERTCIGIVCWVGDDALSDDALLKEQHPDCTNGLVVALQYAGAMLWSDQYETITTAWINKEGNPYKSTVDLRKDKVRCGYSNTLALTDYNAGKYSSAVGSSSGKRVLPIDAIQKYAVDHPAPASSSGWYFPSVMELRYVCWGQGNEQQGTSGKEKLNTNINKVGGTPFGNDGYWSSTENDNDYYAWYVYFYDGSVGNYGYKNYATFRVRPLLAF